VQKVAARLSQRWRVTRRFTSVRRLVLTALPAGARVRLRCSGRTCPFKTRQARLATGSSLRLTGLLKGARLAPGTRLRLAISAPNRSAQTLVLRVRAGRTPVLVGL
jgi:hypothetical protein